MALETEEREEAGSKNTPFRPLVAGPAGSLNPLAVRIGLAAALLFAYLNLFIWPDAPIFTWGDQAIFLQSGVKLAAGQVMYRDFFFFTLPGTETFYSLLIRTFGARAWIPNVSLLLLGVGLVWLSIRISSRIVRGVTAFLPGFLFLGTGYRSWLDATHHWFSVFFVVAATAVVIESRSVRRMACAGALLGVASCFTQTRGPAGIVALSVFLLWEWHGGERSWRDTVKAELAMIGASVAVLFSFCSYFADRAGLANFLWATLVFPLKYSRSYLPWNSWGVYLWPMPRLYHVVTFGIWCFINGLIPAVFVVFFAAFWRYRKSHPEMAWKPAMLVALVGVFLFATVAYAPGFDRLCEISMPAIMVLVFLLSGAGKATTMARRGLWIFTLTMLVILPIRVQTRWHAILKLPAGGSAFLDPETYAEYKWIAERTRPGERFFEAGFSDIYFMLHLENPTAVHLLTRSQYTRPSQVKDVVSCLERLKVRWILWTPELLGQVDDSQRREGLGPLRRLILADYREVKEFADGDQMWELAPSSGTTVGRQGDRTPTADRVKRD